MLRLCWPRTWVTWATAISTSAFLIDPDDPAEMAEAKRLNGRMIDRALAMGGTSTGEHGIGCGKLDYLEAEHGAGATT